MTAYDPSGIERLPFDGRTGPPRPSGGPGFTEANHGPTCRPSNPEIGCECGYAEWLEEERELRDLRVALDTPPERRDEEQARAVAYYLAHGGAR